LLDKLVGDRGLHDEKELTSWTKNASQLAFKWYECLVGYGQLIEDGEHLCQAMQRISETRRQMQVVQAMMQAIKQHGSLYVGQFEGEC